LFLRLSFFRPYAVAGEHTREAGPRFPDRIVISTANIVTARIFFNVLLCHNTVKNSMLSFTVCIPAAGSGDRMRSATPKQYLVIAGKPVLYHTLALFASMKECERIVIATDDRARIRSITDEGTWDTPIDIVLGGARRQDSVQKAVSAVESDKSIVLIHDAARPCVRQEHVRAVASAVKRYGAALLAMPARDTLKRVSGTTIVETLDRSSIWHAQTPQGARAGALREAFAAAARDGVEGTDDVYLLERRGVHVAVVSGSATNLKITEAGDLVLAEAILSARQRGVVL
jgi:2-C-methyl-D-erythritol 4-phosphate cytidylyltransferase